MPLVARSAIQGVFCLRIELSVDIITSNTINCGVKMAENKKILVVEDEKAISEALTLKLEHSGYTVEAASNGEEGLALAQKGNFDLVVLDLIMPKLDGFGFLEEAKKAGVKTPVIVASNLSQPEDETRARDLGAKDFYIKSNVSVAEIVEKIESILK